MNCNQEVSLLLQLVAPAGKRAVGLFPSFPALAAASRDVTSQVPLLRWPGGGGAAGVDRDCENRRIWEVLQAHNQHLAWGGRRVQVQYFWKDMVRILPGLACVLQTVAGNFYGAACWTSGRILLTGIRCGEVSTRGTKPPIQIKAGERKHCHVWDWFRLNWSVQ